MHIKTAELSLAFGIAVTKIHINVSTGC